MDTTATQDTPAGDALNASFDIVTRQDAADAAITSLQGDVEEVKGRLDKVSIAAARPVLSAMPADGNVQVKGFVDNYLRKGFEAELKSIDGAVLADGGYALPKQIDEKIADQLRRLNPIRAISQVVQTNTATYRKLITTGGFQTGWVSETAARPATNTPTFVEIAPPMGELYANISATQAMLDDVAFSMENWLAAEIAADFARAEGTAFITGSGVNQPKGFLTQPTSTANDTTRPFGTLQYLPTGNATGLGTNPELTLLDLVHAVRPGHRQGATWVMNSATLSAVRKLKAADGSFLWQPGIADGQPQRLIGYPVVEAEDMPDIGANAFPIAFGNFQNGYLIAERKTTSILRDPFTNKPFVQFYAVKRIGGQVLDSDAIKVLKIATS